MFGCICTLTVYFQPLGFSPTYKGAFRNVKICHTKLVYRTSSMTRTSMVRLPWWFELIFESRVNSSHSSRKQIFMDILFFLFFFFFCFCFCFFCSCFIMEMSFCAYAMESSHIMDGYIQHTIITKSKKMSQNYLHLPPDLAPRLTITKTRLFKYIENFTSKQKKFR